MPLLGFKHSVYRKVEFPYLVRFSRQVELLILGEVFPHDTIGGHGDDRVAALASAVEARDHVEVEVQVDVLALGRAGVDGRAGRRRLKQRRHALLTVQQVALKLGGRGGRAFDRACGEHHLARCVESHERTDRKALRDRREKIDDPLLIPNPSALKVRQLKPTVATGGHEALQGLRIGSERRRHWDSPCRSCSG